MSDVPGSAPPAIDVETGPVDSHVGAGRFSAVARGVRSHLLDVGIVAVVTLTVFPALVRYPTTGVDAGYRAGLNLAAQQGLGFGSDLVFTYGPWGFLAFPFMYGSRQWLLVVVVAVLSRIVVVALSYALLRRSLSRWWTFGVLLIGLPPLLPQHIVYIVIALTGGLLIVFAGRDLRWGWLVAAGGYTAFIGLVKIDSASICLAVLGLASAVSCWWCESWQDAMRQAVRRAATFVGSVVTAGLVLWLVAGQALSDVVPYVRGSVAASTGFASSMGSEEPGRGREYLFAAVLVGAIVVLFVAARAVDRRLRLALGAFSLIVVYLVFRQGFTRHDVHSVAFFVPVVFLVGGLVSVWGWRRTLPLGFVALVFCYLVSDAMAATRLRVDDRIDEAATTAQHVASGAKRAEFIDEGRQRLRELYELDPSLFASVEGATVHVSPDETSIAWAYPDLVWSPLPVFQEYTAYEASLDDLNANRYDSDSSAPQTVLRRPGASVDQRLSRWESPEASLALLCRYAVVADAGGWVVAERGDDRCGEPRVVRGGSVSFGEAIELPGVGRDEVLVGRFSGINASLADRARTTLFRSRAFDVWGDDGVRHRFVPGTQGQWHLLSTPPCAAELLDGPQRWDTTTLAFSTGDRSPGATTIGYELAVVPFTCA